jgi:hypothetical protein
MNGDKVFIGAVFINGMFMAMDGDQFITIVANWTLINDPCS